ncbi:MAG: hypothetical protein ACR65Z_07270 [Methylocystis sp.]
MKDELHGTAILIVSEEAIVARFLAFAVEDRGGTIISFASSLTETIAKWDSGSLPAPAVAILDVNDYSEELKALLVRLVAGRVPVIVCAPACFPVMAKQFPRIHVLIKPVSSEELYVSLLRLAPPTRP